MFIFSNELVNSALILTGGLVAAFFLSKWAHKKANYPFKPGRVLLVLMLCMAISVISILLIKDANEPTCKTTVTTTKNFQDNTSSVKTSETCGGFTSALNQALPWIIVPAMVGFFIFFVTDPD